MDPVRRVVILAPGRSGSTLLQSAFLSHCDSLTFFEPCRHSPLGDVRREKCVAQVLRFLDCDLPRRNGDWDPPSIRGWLRHPYNDANTTCAQPPLRSVAQTADRCRTAQLVLVKEIRLVGQLALLADALQRRGRGAALSTAIVHLVRDPRAMLASQKRLHWWSLEDSLPHRQTAHELERVAAKTCHGMIADADAGESLQRAGRLRYIMVRFEELSSDLKATTARVYGQLGLSVAPATQTWLQRTMGGQCNHAHVRTTNMTTNETDTYEYSTCRTKTARRRRGLRWKHALTAWQKSGLMRSCAGALTRFGYIDPPRV